MNKAWLVLAVWMGWLGVSEAQIEVRCRLQYSRTIQYEPVLATLDIENNTSETLIFTGPQANARLGFEIEQTPGWLVKTLAAPTAEWERLVPRERQVHTMDLVSLYAMAETGPYTVRAAVEWAGKKFLSGKIFLDVVPGLRIAEAVYASPDAGHATRTCTLRTVYRERGEMLLLRLDDEKAEQCFGVLNLGAVVRFFKPVMRLDAQGRVHVLHQSGPAQFTHSVFTLQGRKVQQDVYNGRNLDVRLQEAGDGQLVVEGAEPYRPEPEAPPPAK